MIDNFCELGWIHSDTNILEFTTCKRYVLKAECTDVRSSGFHDPENPF